MGMFVQLQALLVMPISHAVGCHPKDIMLCDSLALIVSLITNKFSGSILFMIGARACLAVSSMIFSFFIFMAFILMMHHHLTLYSYILIVFFYGVALGLVYPALNHTILNLKENVCYKSRALCLLNVIWNLGFFFSGAMFSLLAAFHLQLWLLFGLFSLFFCYSIFNFYVIFNDPGCCRSPKPSIPLKSAMHPFGVLITGVILLTVTFSQNTIEYWFPVHLQLGSHLNLSSVAFIMSGFGLAQAIGRLSFAIFYVNRNIFIFLWLSFLALIIGTLVFTSAHDFLSSLIIVFMIGLSSSCLIPLLMSIGSRTESDYIPSYTGFFIFMNTLGSLTSFLFNSGVISTISTNYSFFVTPCMLAAGLMLSVVVGINQNDKKSLKAIFHASPR